MKFTPEEADAIRSMKGMRGFEVYRRHLDRQIEAATETLVATSTDKVQQQQGYTRALRQLRSNIDKELGE